MCRVALIHSGPDHLIQFIADLQANGANRQVECWQHGKITLIHSRFDVTSASFATGFYPLEGKRYVVHYNGEVYAFRDRVLIDEPDFECDVHFASSLLEQYGLEAFLREVDFQGTYQIYDKQTEDVYVVVDQVNTSGCFYALYEGCTVVAQEYPIVHKVLEHLGAPDNVPIQLLEGGHYLVISKDSAVTSVSYRPDRRLVWGGKKVSQDHFGKKIEQLRQAIRKATYARIPQKGPVAVLCGGGIDSSVVLAEIVDILRNRQELNRLKVFTFGGRDIGDRKEEANDLVNVEYLLSHLELDLDKYLVRIPKQELDIWREFLLRNKVFCNDPRLITPNPILTSQVRHTVVMSCVLAYVVNKFPEIKVVLSGDGADELLAGYNSMREGAMSASDVRNRIIEKLRDFPINDAGRVALSSFHGVVSVIKEFCLKPVLQALECTEPTASELLNDLNNLTAETIRNRIDKNVHLTEALEGCLVRLHPIEVRMPFTSHYVLRALRDAPPEYLVGTIGDIVVPKFILRAVALSQNLPPRIVLRKKIPFNEGGSGVRNVDHDNIELAVSKSFVSTEDLLERARRFHATLMRLGMISTRDQLDLEYVHSRHDELALLVAAHNGGLARLIRGNVFRQKMPDSVYSTENVQDEYLPSRMIEYN